MVTCLATKFTCPGLPDVTSFELSEERGGGGENSASKINGLILCKTYQIRATFIRLPLPLLHGQHLNFVQQNNGSITY